MRRRDLHDKNPRRFGAEAEKRLQNTGGYRATPNSGAGSVKGDMRRGDFMVEVKRTKFDSYKVSAETMGKLRNDGLTNGMEGVLIVELGTGEKFAVLPLATFEKLVPDAD